MILKRFFLLFGILVICFLGLILYQLYIFGDRKLHIVFCNVGQGDGILIRTPEGLDIIVDGGVGKEILSCLSKYTPFWDRTIELVVLTHPHLDHFNGFFEVFKRYSVVRFATEKVTNNSQTFKQLESVILSKKIPVVYVFAGDSFTTKDGVEFSIVGPSKGFLEETSPAGTIGETKEFGSVETLVTYKSFQTLLTGDSQASELKQAVARGVKNITVLQIPHHGSRSGITRELLETLSPKLAVISVGKNKYGHPTKEVLEILRDKDIKILRTDQKGDLEIVSDGEGFIISAGK